MFSSLPQNSILIAPQHIHTLIRKKIIQEKKGIIGLHIYSLSTYLNIHTPQELLSKESFYFQCRKQLTPLSSSIHIYRNTYTSYPFIKQCSTFLEEMKYYQIHPSQLPIQTEAQKELQQILSTLYTIPNTMDSKQETLQKLLQTHLHNVYIYDTFFSYEEYLIVQQLLNSGAKLLKEEHKKGETSFFHSVNMRQEVEAMAQYIIEHQLCADDINITVCDEAYKPLIHQIFERYKIPFTILKQTLPSVFIKRFITLLKYHMNPCKQTLQACIDAHIWNLPHIYEYSEYTRIFHKHIHDSFHHLEDIQHTNQIINDYELHKLKTLQSYAQEVKEQLLPIIMNIEHATSYEQLFIHIYDIVVASFNSHTSLPTSVQTLQHILQDTLSYIHTNEDLSFLINILEDIQEQEYASTIQGIPITDLQSPLLPTPYNFILGSTQKNFPAFQTKQGIFDEAYIKQIPYPTMKERYDHHLSQMNTLYYRAQHMIVSYPMGTYEGKANEAALEMESFLQKKAKPYPLYTNYQEIPQSYTITSTTAKQLFTKDNVLKGSISAFERYIQCPFSYFLRYGLQIKDPVSYGFNESKVGTLSHHILESLTNEYGKEYVYATSEHILNILEQELSYMRHLYPNHEAFIMAMKQRLLENIMQNLAILKEMEEHSHLTPTKTEYSFIYDIMSSDIMIRLHGFIDRIDEAREFIRIIDYKSSIKSLKEQDVFSALQLQLVTYAIVARKHFQKDIVGAYYYSLKNENIPFHAGKMQRRPVSYIPLQTQDYEDAIYQTHRLQGWTMHEDIMAIDDTGTHIVGVSMQKDGLIKARKLYNLDVLEQHFHELYQTIGKRIIKGDIDCKPSEDACLFCNYKEICRYKGTSEKKELLVNIDESIYQKGGV